MLVIHGIGTRDRESFLEDVGALGQALGERVRLIPLYWGDLGGLNRPLDDVLPYLDWSKGVDAASGGREPATADSESAAGRDLGDVLDSVAAGWKRRSASSRRRLLAAIYRMVRLSYQRASGEFTADLVLYQRRQWDFHARVWETLMSEAPGYGTAQRPIDVITHSLGGSIVFDMAVSGKPALHIRNLFTCASQISYFHLVGCSPRAIDPTGSGPHVTLPPTIGRWSNFFVPLDPWAFLAAPLFTMSDGQDPADIEVFGDTGARVMTHAASYYWSHPIVRGALREGLAS